MTQQELIDDYVKIKGKYKNEFESHWQLKMERDHLNKLHESQLKVIKHAHN